MNFDDILSDAISQGKAVLAERKKKPREKKAAQKASLESLLSRPIPVVAKGQYHTTCLVAEYVRRSCSTCGKSELSTIPRVFICEQLISDPSTRRLHRIFNQDTIFSRFQEGLPVKTEVHTVPSPFCTNCLQGVLDYASRTTTERPNAVADVCTVRTVPATLFASPGAVSSDASPEVPAWGFRFVSDGSDSTRPSPAISFPSRA